MRAKIKFFISLTILGLCIHSCNSSNEEEKNPGYSHLTKDRKEAVKKIDKAIDKLQNKMEKAMQGFETEAKKAQNEVYEKWGKFSNSVKETHGDQKKINEIRKKIVELQQKKMKLLENPAPQK